MTIKGVIETIQILPLLENGEGNNDKMYKWKREEKIRGERKRRLIYERAEEWKKE
jgi:hypothetical protein